MDIYWLGHGCFRLRGRDATVVTDPASPSTGYKIGRIPADVVTISNSSPESNNLGAIQGEPKVLEGPGEYEISGVLISAIRTPNDPKNSDPARNTAFVFDLDDVRICHLGNIAMVPHQDDFETLGRADVLIVPIGGGNVLDVGRAAETISVLEPKIIIPMQYKTDVSTGELETLDRFLKEMGAESKTPEARLTVTKSNVPSSTTVVVLSYRG
jgi:L-ascorbate metabolism protein UlaG (beta-lactamase superfamily)